MSEANNFITHFEVSNFKKFDHLVVENIGQFNLITGDNNVGKTSLLESFLFNTFDNERLIYDLHHLLCSQQIHYHAKKIFTEKPIFPSENYLNFIKNNQDKSMFFVYNEHKIEIKDTLYFELSKIELAKFKTKKSVFTPNEDLKYWITIYRNNYLDEVQWLYEDDYYSQNTSQIKYGYIPIVKFHNFYERDLNEFMKELTFVDLFNLSTFDYGNIVKIIQRLIIHDIIDINIQKINNDKNEMIFIATKSSKGLYVNVTRFGDGVQKIIRYLIEVYYAKKIGYNYFLIDEIDTGIHFSRLKIFWKEFLSLCKELDIQLFATTHSQECIETYAQALDELGMKEKGRLIELEEYTSKENVVKQISTTYIHSDLIYRLNVNDNLRGETRI